MAGDGQVGPTIRAKVVMVGAPMVGKTSMVRRFVHEVFSEDYVSTLGVKVDRKTVTLGGAVVSMILWDIHGETDSLKVPTTYFRGASAALMVIDGSRPETIEPALRLGAQVKEVSARAKIIPVVNKVDLGFDWDPVLSQLADAGYRDPVRASAKLGDGVEEAFVGIAESLLG